MTDVKRYMPGTTGSAFLGMCEIPGPGFAPQGAHFVLATDYEALRAQLAEAERMEGQAHERVRELEAEKGRVNPPFDVALPKITAEILESYEGFGFIRKSDEGYAWTTEAIDFAAEIVRPAVQARIGQLEETLREIDQLSRATGDAFWGALYRCGALARLKLPALASPGREVKHADR